MVKKTKIIRLWS